MGAVSEPQGFRVVSEWGDHHYDKVKSWMNDGRGDA
jgi:hypothetical protein